MRLVLAHPRGEQARHDGPDPGRLATTSEPKVLPDIAEGKMASYALSEREAGSDAGAHAHSRRARRRRLDPQRLQGWITNGGKSTWYTVMAVTDPDKGANGISAFMVHKDDEGFGVGSKEKKLGIKGSPTAELYFENCRIPGDRIIGEPGTGFKTALRDARPHAPDHRRAGRRPRTGRTRRGDLVHQGPQAVRQVDCDFQNTQFMLADMAMKVEAARLMVYTAAANAERGTAAGGGSAWA